MEKCPLLDSLLKLLNNCPWVFWREAGRCKGVEIEKAAAADVPQEGNGGQRSFVCSASCLVGIKDRRKPVCEIMVVTEQHLPVSGLFHRVGLIHLLSA